MIHNSDPDKSSFCLRHSHNITAEWEYWPRVCLSVFAHKKKLFSPWPGSRRRCKKFPIVHFELYIHLYSP